MGTRGPPLWLMKTWQNEGAGLAKGWGTGTLWPLCLLGQDPLTPAMFARALRVAAASTTAARSSLVAKEAFVMMLRPAAASFATLGSVLESNTAKRGNRECLKAVAQDLAWDFSELQVRTFIHYVVVHVVVVHSSFEPKAVGWKIGLVCTVAKLPVIVFVGAFSVHVGPRGLACPWFIRTRLQEGHKIGRVDVQRDGTRTLSSQSLMWLCLL